MAARRPSALVICAGDPARDPRPNRTLRWLAPDFAVRALCSGDGPLPDATRVPLPAPTGHPALRKLRAAVALKLRRYESRLWPDSFRALVAREAAHAPAFITVHDLALLPLALAIRDAVPPPTRPRVFFDAREYYSRHFEDRWFWRFFLQDFNQYLCSTYLRRADLMVTVNRGLAAEYQREFGVACGVLPSFPAPAALTPGPVDPQHVRIIHHGFATKTRRLELMIEAVQLADARFHLDLMLAGEERGYVEFLRQRAAGHPRIRFRDPVSFRELVADTNRYDIGLYLLPPTSFNTRHALPNKFFEFIQARLMLVIGPSPEMSPFVHEPHHGLVAPDFARRRPQRPHHRADHALQIQLPPRRRHPQRRRPPHQIPPHRRGRRRPRGPPLTAVHPTPTVCKSLPAFVGAVYPTASRGAHERLEPICIRDIRVIRGPMLATLGMTPPTSYLTPHTSHLPK
jgi:hypothetical protein